MLSYVRRRAQSENASGNGGTTFTYSTLFLHRQGQREVKSYTVKQRHQRS